MLDSTRRVKTNGIQALLFDLGGVLIDIDFDRAFAHWQPISRLSVSEFKATFEFDAPYQLFERGEITAAKYFAHLRTRLQLRDDPVRIAEGWNAIFRAEITETRRLVEAARTRIPCYVLTNSNGAHQAAWSALFPALVQSFERVFVSCEIGHRKPERAAFEFVGRELGIPLGSILFFDDTFENVSAAAAAGLIAIHVRAPEDVRAALQTHLKLGAST